jgi:uncharacterized membrane protein YkoI
MFRTTQHKFTALAAVAAAGLGGAAIANAASDSNGSSSSSSNGSSSQTDPARSNEKTLSGDTATKVKEAALAKVPGTVLRVESDQGGVYEAHIRKADGTEVEVKVDKDFKVTATEERGPGGPGGHGGGHGGRGGPGGGEKALTGDTAAKVEKAATAKVAGTVLRVESDNGGVYEAHIRKSDGTEVEVKVDKSFNVTDVQEHAGPPAQP